MVPPASAAGGGRGRILSVLLKIDADRSASAAVDFTHARSEAKPLQRYFAVNVLESPVPYNRLVLLSRLVLSCSHIDRSTSYEYV